MKWVTLEEGTLRQRVTTDIATKGGQFDVMTIGLYEAPIWSKKRQSAGTSVFHSSNTLSIRFRTAATWGETM